jgi:hypothetical protein
MTDRARRGTRAAVDRAARQSDRLSLPRSLRVARTLAAHPHRSAAAALALLVVVELWPALVGGRMLSPIAVLYAFPPWQAGAPPHIGRLINPALLDVPLSYYPWQVLARGLLHAGTFPAWNPYAFSGTPLFANFELAWLSPFSLPLWILPLHYALGVAAALKLWAAGFGAYLLARELRLGAWPALLAGVSFALCAFNVIWLSHGVQVSAAALLPWTLWLVERIVRRGGAGDGLALAGVAALVLVSGHPGTELHVLAGAALYGLVRAAVSRDVARAQRLRRLGLAAAALALAGALAAVVLLPAAEAARGTVGVAARSHGAGFYGERLPLGALRTALFPDWWGRPAAVLAGPADYNERTFYAGALGLMLAALALVSRGRWRAKAPLVLLGALGAAIPVHLLGLYGLLAQLPGFDHVQNQRLLLWFLLAVALLAGFGCQELLDAPRRAGRAWGVVACATLAGAVAVLTLHVRSGTLGRAAHAFLHRGEIPLDAAPALAAIAWWLVLAAALAGILLLARLRPNRRAAIGAVAVLVAALDLLHFAHGYQPIGPASTLVAPRTPAVAYLQAHTRGAGRIAAVGSVLPSDWTTVYGLRDARGYDAPQPSFRFHRLWTAAIDPELPLGGSYQVPALDRARLRALGLFGVRYVAAAPGTRAPAGVGPPVYRGRDATVFANRFAMARAIVPARVVVAGGEAQQIAAAAGAALDPRRDAVVAGDELPAGTSPPAGVAGGRAQVVSERDARVTLRATLPRAGLVVLDDAWERGWSVTVDGRPARTLHADVVLRGVLVPAGSHEIVWRYAVPGLGAGAAISGAGLLVALAWGGWLIARARRRAR